MDLEIIERVKTGYLKEFLVSKYIYTTNKYVYELVDTDMFV